MRLIASEGSARDPGESMMGQRYSKHGHWEPSSEEGRLGGGLSSKEEGLRANIKPHELALSDLLPSKAQIPQVVL